MTTSSPPPRLATSDTLTIGQAATRGWLAIIGLLAAIGLGQLLVTWPALSFRLVPTVWAHGGHNFEIACCWALTILGGAWAVQILIRAIRKAPIFVFGHDGIDAWDDLGWHWRIQKADIQRAVFYTLRGRAYVSIVGNWMRQHRSSKRNVDAMTRPLAALDTSRRDLEQLLKAQGIQILCS
jgi:hypothetical protein